MGSIRKSPRTLGRSKTDTRWEVRYRDPAGRQRTRGGFQTKGEATAYLSTVETDMLRGSWCDPQRSRTTFEEWARHWLAAATGHIKPTTRESYRQQLDNHLVPYFGKTPLGSIEHVDVVALLSGLRTTGGAPASPRLRQKVFAVLRMVMAEAVRSRYINATPCADVHLGSVTRREMNCLTAAQVRALAEAVAHPERNPKDGRRAHYPEYGLLVTVAAYTGLRAGELGALRVRRLDLLRGRVEVAESAYEISGRVAFGTPKNGRTRTVSIPKFLRDQLADHIKARGAGPDDFVFTSPTGGVLRHNLWYRRYFKPAVAAAGLPSTVRFHDLRHTCAALLIQAGAHPKAICERLGHSSIQVTMDIYGHLLPGLDEQLGEGLEVAYQGALTDASETLAGAPVVAIHA